MLTTCLVLFCILQVMTTLVHFVYTSTWQPAVDVSTGSRNFCHWSFFKICMMPCISRVVGCWIQQSCFRNTPWCSSHAVVEYLFLLTQCSLSASTVRLNHPRCPALTLFSPTTSACQVSCSVLLEYCVCFMLLLVTTACSKCAHTFYTTSELCSILLARIILCWVAWQTLLLLCVFQVHCHCPHAARLLWITGSGS